MSATATTITTEADFFKNMISLMFSVMTFTLMLITTAIVIYTGEPTTTCSAFAGITFASLLASLYFTVKVSKY